MFHNTSSLFFIILPQTLIYPYKEYILNYTLYSFYLYILLTKTTAAKNEDALSYYKVRGLYFLAVVFVRSIVLARAYTIRFELISCFLPCYIYLVNCDNPYTFGYNLYLIINLCFLPVYLIVISVTLYNFIS